MPKDLYQDVQEKLSNYDLELSSSENGYSISFKQDKDNVLLKIFQEVCLKKGYNLLLKNQNGNCSLVIYTNNPSIDLNYLLTDIRSAMNLYEENHNYLSEMDKEIANIYELFKNSLNYPGNFGIGIANYSTNKKYMVKTDMKEMQELLKQQGLEFEDNRLVVSSLAEEEIQNAFLKAVQTIQDKSIENQEKKEKDEVPELSSFQDHIYERLLATATGLNAHIRLSILHDGEELSERIIQATYIHKEDGVIANKETLEYKDGEDFDNNILPQIIEDFQKNVLLDGKNVEVNEVDPTKCYLHSEGEENDIYLEGYDVNQIRSLVTSSKEDLLSPKAEKRNDLQEEQINPSVDEIPSSKNFEEMTMDSPIKEESSEKKILHKSLGEYPTSRAGLSNWMMLAFFLAIDFVAIAVGVYFLLS